MGLSGAEWSNDWYSTDYYSHSPVYDPQGPVKGLSLIHISPAQVLTITDSLPSTLPAPVQDPLLIIGTGFTASRREALRVSLLAVPYSETLCWRPPLLPRPNVRCV